MSHNTHQPTVLESHTAAPNQTRGKATSSNPWLCDRMNLLSIAIVLIIAGVLCARIALLPWADYRDYTMVLNQLGLTGGVLAALMAAWRFSSHGSQTMLMAPTGLQSLTVRYIYIAVANVFSILIPLVIGAAVLFIPLIGSNSWDFRFVFSPLLSAIAFVIGSTAVGIVVATATRSMLVIVRVILAGGICLLFGMYSASIPFLWAVGVLRDSEAVFSAAQLQWLGITFVLSVVAFAGACVFAGTKADPYTRFSFLAYLPFAAGIAGVVLGVATGSLPIYSPQVLCESTRDAKISICVNTARQPALAASVESANSVIKVLGNTASQPVVYTPFYGSTEGLGQEINYQPQGHSTNMGQVIIESVVSTAHCDGNNRPESAHVNGVLLSRLMAEAGLTFNLGVVRDSSGRIVKDVNTEGESINHGDPLAHTPLEVIKEVIAAHPQEIAECTAKWEWFGVNP